MTDTDSIRTAARALGFTRVGIAPAVVPGGIHHFLQWLKGGYAGTMDYLSRRAEAYQHPRFVLDGVRCVIMLAAPYGGGDRAAGDASHPASHPAPHAAAHLDSAPAEEGRRPSRGRVARYASVGRDYHDVLREKLSQLGQVVQRLFPGCLTRGVVDTAPLLERDFARLAGLGWFGKNTMLLDKFQGSYAFLAALLTDVELEPDQPHDLSHCGTCTRCLDACPTDAFIEPYVLDARKCISYLTIEHRGHIPRELRPEMGEWLFGCDVCQEVCPWNRKSPPATIPDLEPRADLLDLSPLDILAWDEPTFRRELRGTPLTRPKRAGLVRNAAIVVGNQRDERAIPRLTALLDDPDPVIRAACAWALGELRDPTVRAALQQRQQVETDEIVQYELAHSLESAEAP